MKDDIRFVAEGGGTFKYRAVALVRRADTVLLCKVSQLDYEFLPGGRVAFGESAAQACAREVEEELGVSLPVRRLRLVVENLYAESGQSEHEIGLYFDVDGEAFDASLSANWQAGHHFRWVRLPDLDQVRFEPKTLEPLLRQLPNELAHVVLYRDDNHEVDGWVGTHGA
jgi:ADP-ribose pyrophosphatase YjhB (NUDIX family)